MKIEIIWPVGVGPTVEEVRKHIDQGPHNSAYCSPRLRAKMSIHVGHVRGKECSVVALRKATAAEVQHIWFNVAVALLYHRHELDNSMVEVRFKVGERMPAQLCHLAVKVEQAIRLLRKAPKDSRVAEARVLLQAGLKRFN